MCERECERKSAYVCQCACIWVLDMIYLYGYMKYSLHYLSSLRDKDERTYPIDRTTHPLYSDLTNSPERKNNKKERLATER